MMPDADWCRICGLTPQRFSSRWAWSPAWSRSISVAATGRSRSPSLASQGASTPSTLTLTCSIARARVATAGATNCHFVVADAMRVDAVVPEPVDYVFLTNTFHGIPDQLRLARAVTAILKPCGQFGIVNWHRRPREETAVLGQPRGPKTEMRMEVRDVTAVVEPAGLVLNRTVELAPYHYGAVLRRRCA